VLIFVLVYVGQAVVVLTNTAVSTMSEDNIPKKASAVTRYSLEDIEQQRLRRRLERRLEHAPTLTEEKKEHVNLPPREEVSYQDSSTVQNDNGDQRHTLMDENTTEFQRQVYKLMEDNAERALQKAVPKRASATRKSHVVEHIPMDTDDEKEPVHLPPRDEGSHQDSNPVKNDAAGPRHAPTENMTTDFQRAVRKQVNKNAKAKRKSHVMVHDPARPVKHTAASAKPTTDVNLAMKEIMTTAQSLAEISPEQVGLSNLKMDSDPDRAHRYRTGYWVAFLLTYSDRYGGSITNKWGFPDIDRVYAHDVPRATKLKKSIVTAIQTAKSWTVRLRNSLASRTDQTRIQLQYPLQGTSLLSLTVCRKQRFSKGLVALMVAGVHPTSGVLGYRTKNWAACPFQLPTKLQPRQPIIQNGISAHQRDKQLLQKDAQKINEFLTKIYIAIAKARQAEHCTAPHRVNTESSLDASASASSSSSSSSGFGSGSGSGAWSEDAGNSDTDNDAIDETIIFRDSSDSDSNIDSDNDNNMEHKRADDRENTTRTLSGTRSTNRLLGEGVGESAGHDTLVEEQHERVEVETTDEEDLFGKNGCVAIPVQTPQYEEFTRGLYNGLNKWFLDSLLEASNAPTVERLVQLLLPRKFDLADVQLLHNLLSSKWRKSHLDPALSASVRKAFDGNHNAQFKPQWGLHFSGFGILTHARSFTKPLTEYYPHAIAQLQAALPQFHIQARRAGGLLFKPPSDSTAGSLPAHIDGMSFQTQFNTLLPHIKTLCQGGEAQAMYDFVSTYEAGIQTLFHVDGGTSDKDGATWILGPMTVTRHLWLLLMLNPHHLYTDMPIPGQYKGVKSHHQLFEAENFPLFYKEIVSKRGLETLNSVFAGPVSDGTPNNVTLHNWFHEKVLPLYDADTREALVMLERCVYSDRRPLSKLPISVAGENGNGGVGSGDGAIPDPSQSTLHRGAVVCWPRGFLHGSFSARGCTRLSMSMPVYATKNQTRTYREEEDYTRMTQRLRNIANGEDDKVRKDKQPYARGAVHKDNHIELDVIRKYFQPLMITKDTDLRPFTNLFVAQKPSSVTKRTTKHGHPQAPARRVGAQHALLATSDVVATPDAFDVFVQQFRLHTREGWEAFGKLPRIFEPAVNGFHTVVPSVKPGKQVIAWRTWHTTCGSVTPARYDPGPAKITCFVDKVPLSMLPQELHQWYAWAASMAPIDPGSGSSRGAFQMFRVLHERAKETVLPNGIHAFGLDDEYAACIKEARPCDLLSDPPNSGRYIPPYHDENQQRPGHWPRVLAEQNSDSDSDSDSDSNSNSNSSSDSDSDKKRDSIANTANTQANSDASFSKTTTETPYNTTSAPVRTRALAPAATINQIRVDSFMPEKHDIIYNSRAVVIRSRSTLQNPLLSVDQLMLFQEQGYVVIDLPEKQQKEHYAPAMVDCLTRAAHIVFDDPFFDFSDTNGTSLRRCERHKEAAAWATGGWLHSRIMQKTPHYFDLIQQERRYVPHEVPYTVEPFRVSTEFLHYVANMVKRSLFAKEEWYALSASRRVVEGETLDLAVANFGDRLVTTQSQRHIGSTQKIQTALNDWTEAFSKVLHEARVEMDTWHAKPLRDREHRYYTPTVEWAPPKENPSRGAKCALNALSMPGGRLCARSGSAQGGGKLIAGDSGMGPGTTLCSLDAMVSFQMDPWVDSILTDLYASNGITAQANGSLLDTSDTPATDGQEGPDFRPQLHLVSVLERFRAKTDADWGNVHVDTTADSLLPQAVHTVLVSARRDSAVEMATESRNPVVNDEDTARLRTRLPHIVGSAEETARVQPLTTSHNSFANEMNYAVPDLFARETPLLVQTDEREAGVRTVHALVPNGATERGSDATDRVTTGHVSSENIADMNM
jgi:hypothetical protein